MAVLLDTSDLAVGDRFEAFRTGMLEVSGSTRIDLEIPPGGVSARMFLYDFGASRVFAAESTGVSMARDTRAARSASPEAVAIAVHGVGVGRHATGNDQRLVRTGDVMVVDITRPFDFSWSGPGSSTSLQVPIAELGMSLEAVQRAGSRLESSPLYRIVSRHLVELTEDAERLSASPMAPTVGDATVQLVRALLAGAGEGEQASREIIEQTLLSQIHVYIRQNLTDPTLGPDSIARALAVSRRQLFRICTRADLSLEQYIIGKRLEGAKEELGSPAARWRSIAAVALRWGFKDPTHFSRRFKDAYGLLPRDWRRLAHKELP
jgi:AraC-like DNA-binding protein